MPEIILICLGDSFNLSLATDGTLCRPTPQRGLQEQSGVECFVKIMTDKLDLRSQIANLQSEIALH